MVPSIGLGPTALRNLRHSRRRCAARLGRSPSSPCAGQSDTGYRPGPTSRPSPRPTGRKDHQAISTITLESHGTDVSSARSADTHAGRLEEARGWLWNRHHLAVEAAVLIVVYLVYDFSRGLVSGAGAIADRHGYQVAHAERHLSLYIEPVVQHGLQRVPGLFDVFGFGYDVFQIGVTAVVLVWMYLRRPHAFPAIRTTLIASVALALVVFGLYPTAPPRMAHLGIGDSLALSCHTSKSPVLSALYNPYAAMPSLHMAFAVIAGGSIAVYARQRWSKIAGLVYPLFVAAKSWPPEITTSSTSPPAPPPSPSQPSPPVESSGPPFRS